MKASSVQCSLALSLCPSHDSSHESREGTSKQMDKQKLDLACNRSATKVGSFAAPTNPNSSPMSSKATVLLEHTATPAPAGCAIFQLRESCTAQSPQRSQLCHMSRRPTGAQQSQSATPPHTGVFFVVRALHADVDPKLMQDPMKPRDQIKRSTYHDWFVAQFWLHPVLRPRDMSLHGSIPCKRALVDQAAKQMPPRGVALGFILIHQGVYDETRGEWMTFGMRKEYNTTQTS